VLSVACAWNDGLVVSGSADQTVRAWRREADGRGHTCVAVIDGHASAVRSVALALVPHGQKRRQGKDGDGDEEWRVCSASFDGEVRVWSLRVTRAL
jgi:WD40 repeat protein